MTRFPRPLSLARTLLLAPLLSTIAPWVGAQTGPDVEARLRALEQQVQRLAEENATLRRELGVRDAATAPPPVTVTPAGKVAKLAVGGFLQGQAEFGGAPDARWSGATENDRFFFRRARVYVSGAFAEDFEFKAELDLQGNTLSAGTGHSTRANEIYVGWRKFSAATVRFGQLKPAFGAEQLASDTKLLTIERSLSNDRLTDGRQIAASVLGELFEKRLSYALVVGNGNGANVSGNDNERFQRSARVALTPLASSGQKLTVGVSALQTEDAGVTRAGLGFTGNSFSGKRDGVGADLSFTRGPFDFSAEWLQMTYRPRDLVPDARFRGTGWHVTGAYFLVPARLQAVVRREAFDPNSRRDGDLVESWVLGLNYLLKGDDLKLQLNYLHGDAPAGGTDGRLLTRVQLMF